MSESYPPFCRTKGARAAFERWRSRVVAAGAAVTDADTYVLGLAANRESRLEELVDALAKCKDDGRRLRLISAERLAAGDMAKALELLERTYGAAVPAVQELRATGTGGGPRLVSFPPPTGLGVLGQRIVQALRAHGGQTKAELRQRVTGSEDAFLRGLKAALALHMVKRTGKGTKVVPYRYELEV